MQENRGVTLRAIVIGLILIPPNSYWIAQRSIVWGGSPTYMSIFYNVIFCVSSLTLLNLLVKRLSKRFALNQGELLTIYVILCIGSAMAGLDMVGMLVTLLGHPFWFATPENEWQVLFWKYIPRWLSVNNHKVLAGYYDGSSSLYTVENIKGWLIPVLWWSGFVFVLVSVMLCINVIMRRQWTENEKLSYPIIQLPLEMTKAGGASGFFSNKLLWIGFAIAGGINMLNSLHFFYPTIPSIPIISIDLRSYFVEKPWNAIGWTPLHFYPFMIGLGYFIPLDLSFSYWFFYLFWKVQFVMGSIMGLQGLPEFPYPYAQVYGALMGLVIIVFWTSRRYLFQTLKFAIHRQMAGDSEPMKYRTAMLGIAFGWLILVLFSYMAGMSLWVILLFFTIYFGICIVITRMRAQLGPPLHELNYGGPIHVMQWVAGTRRLGPANLTMFSYYWFFNRSYTCHPMPHQLEGFKLAERTGMSSRRLSLAMIIATIVGIFAAFWAYLDMFYEAGAASGLGWHALGNGNYTFGNNLQHWLNQLTLTDVANTSFMGFGMVFTFFLMMMKTRFLWWSFHPIAYPLARDYNMNRMWFAIFISWVAKKIILKHGGLRSYRAGIPFFIGLILGEFIIGGGWSIIGVIFGIPVYVFWH
jgi:hypothetical protein